MPEIWPVPQRFEPVLASLRADVLDCLQTTFALFAEERHGPGAHLALGSRMLLPTLDSLSRAHLNSGFERRRQEAHHLLAAGCREAYAPATADDVVQFARTAPYCYAIADAFDLGWLPTCGHEHAPHSFAVTVDGFDVVVVDAYTNATPWGDAEPGAWRLSLQDLTSLVRGGVVLRAVDLGPAPNPAQAVSDDMVSTAEASRPLFPAYADELVSRANKGERDAIVLDLWLLARDRRLHSAWLASRGLGAGRETVDRAWTDLAIRAYVLHRRAARGGVRFDALAAELVDRLYADVADLQRPRDREAVRVVKAALEEVLGVGRAEIEAAGDLRDLPGFQSFRLVQVLDTVEARTGREPSFSDGDADMFSVAGIAQLFTCDPAAKAGGDAGP